MSLLFVFFYYLRTKTSIKENFVIFVHKRKTITQRHNMTKREKNLVSLAARSVAERKAIASKGAMRCNEIRRERKNFEAALSVILSTPLNKDEDDLRTALKNMGVKKATQIDALCLKLRNIAMDDDERTADRLKAIELIHKFVDGEKMDFTTNGETINRPPTSHSLEEARRLLEKLEEEY